MKTLCESRIRAKHRLGESLSQKLFARLSDLRAFSNAELLLLGNNLFIAQVDENEEIKIELGEDGFLTLCANHNENPRLNNGEMDWAKVVRVKILDIGAYNDTDKVSS